MAKQLVNVGTAGNKGDGDTLRASFTKINSNFTEVYDDIADLKDGVVATNVTGDLTGSVFAQDSTLLVDAVNGKLIASALTGTVPSGVVVWSNITGTPDSLAEYGITDAYTKAQVEQLVQAPGDVKGSIFGDDSTLLVDGVNSTIPAANLTGALPAIDGSALTGITATANSLVGDMTGSVFADDSTLLVDGVAGKIVGEVDTANGSISNITTTNLYAANSTGVNITANGFNNLVVKETEVLVQNVALKTNSLTSIDGTLNINGDVDFGNSGTIDFTGATITGLDFSSISNTPTTISGYGITDAQAALVSGTNIKTVNGESLLGSGNITISGGSGGAAFTNIGVGADDSTIRTISEGESFLILGGTGITTASDAEGNITITGFDGAFGSLTGTPTTISGYGITDALTAGGALEGSSLQPTDETSASTQGTTLALSGGDSTGLNSDGGDLTLVGGNGSSGTHGDISIGATQTGSITIGSGTNSVDFTSGTTVDFTGTTVTGLNVSGLQSRGTVTGTTSSLADAAEADLDITGFKSYALLAITTDRAARVRLYVSDATRTADASRAEGVDPTSDAGLIAEVITTGAETVIISPGAFGFNLESSPTTTIPCRVTNKSGGTSTVQVDLNILQLEA